MPIAWIFIALGAGAGLVLAYEVANTLLLIFAGVLVAAVLDAAMAGLGRIMPGGRVWRLSVVTLVAAVLIVAGLAYGGISLVNQIQSLTDSVASQWGSITAWLAERGIELSQLGSQDGEGSLSALEEHLPSAGSVFGHVQTFFGSASGVVTNIFVVIFLGVFFAVDPASYRDGFVRLIPVHRRERVREVLTEAGMSLRAWLVGQLAMMLLVAVSVSAMLMFFGISNALLLGAVAGLLNFIPFLGQILGAIPVLFSVMGEGWSTFLGVLAVFTIIQVIEGNLIAPLIQQRAVDISPAMSLAGIAVAGALFGGLGVALATPLLAVIRILVLRLYVEDGLERSGGRLHQV